MSTGFKLALGLIVVLFAVGLFALNHNSNDGLSPAEEAEATQNLKPIAKKTPAPVEASPAPASPTP